MSYNQPGARRGRPRRVLDPSANLSSQSSPMNNPYVNMPQPSPNNGMNPNYGFNIPEPEAPNFTTGMQSGTPSAPAYGYMPPMQNQAYTPNRFGGNEGFGNPQFSTSMLAEPIVTNMAMQYGNALVGTGAEKIAQYIPVTSLKYYFAVDTDYVLTKLILLFFPFTNKDWSIRYEQDNPLQPRFEKNAPDMYIPTMGFLTYVVLASVVLGTQGKFTPEQLGITASSALAWGIVELLVQWITLYSLGLDTSLKTLDLLAYSNYKFVGMNAALLTYLVFKKLGYYIILIYFSISLAFFLMRSLKLRVIPEGNSTYSATGNKRRLYFILFVAFIQPVLMWWLSYHLI